VKVVIVQRCRETGAVSLIASSESPQRPKATVNARSSRAVSLDGNAFNLHRQLPSSVPGMFMRAELPRPRTSCIGKMTVFAEDDINIRIPLECAAALPLPR
jgi:hypothetical protein